MKPLLVYGAGGHGKVVADLARASGWSVVAFVDDDPRRVGTTVLGAPTRSWRDVVEEPGAATRYAVALGLGDNGARSRVHARLTEQGFLLPALVHPRATLAPGVALGAGAVVMAGAVVNPDARVGAGVILNTACIVEHDCIVEDFAHLSPGAALGGAAWVGAHAHVGMKASVLPSIHVGAGARVGAGAVVHRDVGEALTVVGVPARPLRVNPT